MVRALFADPRTDFVFHRLFGTEEHRDLLVALLNALLELDDAHRVVQVDLLPPEQRPQIDELKYSIVDVKCVDAKGTRYVVEMQVLNVEGFEKRVVYNAAKAYTSQLARAQPYPELNDVIGISICNFELWPRGQTPEVPMLSRWRMQEQHGGATGLGQLQLVFLELPKYDTSREPRTIVEKWAYFFRETRHLTSVPPALSEPPLSTALEVARAAGFSEADWDAYIRAEIALQDGRGALSLARKQGLAEGRVDGLRAGIEGICDVLGIELTQARRAEIERRDTEALDALLKAIRQTRKWP